MVYTILQILSESDKSGILGSSQTFLGVLCTVVILCVFKNSKTNFLLLMLKEFENKIKNNNNKYKEEIESRVIFDTVEYDFLKGQISANTDKMSKIILSKKNNNTASQEEDSRINTSADSLYLKIKTYKENLKSELAEPFVAIINVIDEISVEDKNDELVISPFYAFIFCLLVFAADETFAAVDYYSIRVALLSGLYVFTVLSYAMSFVLWKYFFRRTSISFISKYKIGNQKYIPSQQKDKFWIYFSLLLFVLIFVISQLLLFKEIWLGYFALIAILLFFFTYEYGDWMAKKSLCDDFYPGFIPVSMHAVRFFSFSLIITIVMFFVAYLNYIPNIIDLDSNFTLFKLVIFIFVLAHGLFCPFVCPCIRYYIYYLNSKKLRINKYDSIEIEFNNLSQELSRFYSHYNEGHSQKIK